MPVTVCMRTNRSSPGVYNTLSSISSAEILQDKIETQEGYSGPAQEDVRILRAVKNNRKREGRTHQDPLANVCAYEWKCTTDLRRSIQPITSRLRPIVLAASKSRR
jgi:hypothetical protein